MRNVIVCRKRHGKGSLYQEDGTYYEGEWHEGRPHGKGTNWGETGIYTGEWSDGRMEGRGIFQLSNGDNYEGQVAPANEIEFSLLDGTEYAEGKFHGKGKYTFVDGSYYEGNFVRGQVTGRGKYVGSSGDVLEGDFRNSYLHGMGRSQTAVSHAFFLVPLSSALMPLTRSFSGRQEGVIKEGFWMDGCLERKGRIDSPRGDNYIGDFRRGRFEGRGKFKFK